MNIARRSQPKLKALRGQTYTEIDDVGLVILCKNKDQLAFETLVKRHQRSVYARLYKLAPDCTDTSDLAQETFIKVWRGIDKLQTPSAFKSWMMEIVKNICYDELRKHLRQATSLPLYQPINDGEEPGLLTRDIADPAAGPDQLYDRKQLRKSIDDAIGELPGEFRTAIVLRDLDDLSYEKIAKITKTHIGTVKSRISRARSKVQDILRSQFSLENAS